MPIRWAMEAARRQRGGAPDSGGDQLTARKQASLSCGGHICSTSAASEMLILSLDVAVKVGARSSSAASTTSARIISRVNGARACNTNTLREQARTSSLCADHARAFG
jgi:hypothetical protein